MLANSIDDVISILNTIIQDSKSNNSTLGYFAALYKKVTLKVKEGIQDGFFDDGPRMEHLDVIFANRYIKAYFDYQNNKTITTSWLKAFKLSKEWQPIVLQHLLIGMNAHINLDLGIAAAEISKGKDIASLENDFNKINTILSDLVADVEQELSTIWPFLKTILKFTKRADDFLIDFSMSLARDGAWKYANILHNSPVSNWPQLIEDRDQKVAKKADIVSSPGIIVSTLFLFIRLGERGSVTSKIDVLDS